MICVKRRGSFYVGGEKVTLKNAPVEDFSYMDKFTLHCDPNGSHWVKQMYVQYTELEGPKAPYPILMWHGGGLTGVTWETTPDGREGWDTIFLRYGYDVFVSDAVERGRASWAKFPEINPVPPIFHTYEARWLNLKMGEKYPVPYKNQRFPVEYYDQLMMESVPRWVTSDEWTLAAYEKYIERLQKTLPGVIILVHSQGSLYAQKIAQRHPDFIKAIIFVENVCLPNEDEDVGALASIPQLYVYGDFMSDEYTPVHPWVTTYKKSKDLWQARLTEMGADYTWMSLPDMGIKGNSHMLMMDNNSEQIASMIQEWLSSKGLSYSGEPNK